MRAGMRNLWVLTVLSISVLAVGSTSSWQDQLISVFESASPAVVHIRVRGIAEDMFMRPVPVEGAGSGFLVDRQGHIVTNYHVIEGAEEIRVAFGAVDCCPAEIVGIDPSTDLAVIRVLRQNLPDPLVLADSDLVQVGQLVVAIGNPFGLDQTMTFGIVSALQRVIRSPDGRFVGEVIQTDAAINPGNSGGPLLDLNGQVIGVTSQIISPIRAFAGVAFAISSNTVSRVVPALISKGRYPHPYLGLSGVSLTPGLVELLRLVDVDVPDTQGILVTSVVTDGPADLGGVIAGDRIAILGNVELPVGGDIVQVINGVRVETMTDLLVYLDTATSVGDEVEIIVLREGMSRTLRVILQERPVDHSG